VQNRDHYTRPYQGNGRDMFGYGRAEIVGEPQKFPWLTVCVCLGLTIWAGLIWAFVA
jgi:hypothetical protein